MGIFTLFLIALLAFEGKAFEARIDLYAIEDQVELTSFSANNVTTDTPTPVQHCSWKGKSAPFTLSASIAMIPNQRNHVVLEFTPLATGRLDLFLRGPRVQQEDKTLKSVAVYWDDVRIEGASLVNGEFETGQGWNLKGSPDDKEGYGIVSAPSWFGRGFCAKAWHNASLSQRVNVTKGQRVVIEATAGYEIVGLENCFSGQRQETNPNLFVKIPLGSPDPDWSSRFLRFNPAAYVKAPPGRPWTPQTPKENLTDLRGPDGVLYPDFRRAGLRGAVTDFPLVLNLSAFGAKNGQDIADAMEQALAAVPETGGLVFIEEGTYRLSRPILINRDNVIIRGAGTDKTVVDFDFSLPEKGVRLFCSTLPGAKAIVADGQAIPIVSRYDLISIQADPAHLRQISVTVDGMALARQDKRINNSPRYRGVFSCDVMSYMVLKKVGPGNHLLKAIVGWDDGSRTVIERPLHVSENLEEGSWSFLPNNLAAINCNRMAMGQKIPIKGGALRGQLWLTLDHVKGLREGDLIEVTAEPTKRFIREIRSSSPGTPRHQWVLIRKIDGDRVLANQPLRLDFPSADQPSLRKVDVLRNIGIENFTLRQGDCPLWIHGIMMKGVINSWIRNVDILETGRNPVEMYGKFCLVENCRFLGSQYNLGHAMGTAYVGFRRSYDCLMQNVTSVGMRHGPNIDYSASGCVIRNSSFTGSDAQFHFYYPYENLIENCVVDASMGTGAYGFGCFAQEPQVREHGPQGPRNVIYNCDFKSPYAGFWAGGSTEGYRLVYNRFHVGSGPGIFAKSGAFDYMVKGNVFCLKLAYPAGLYLATGDCEGWRIEDNQFFFDSPSPAVGGLPSEVSLKRNTLLGYRNAKRPIPPAPSLLDWQRKNDPLEP
jgi:hypothetical protein